MNFSVTIMRNIIIVFIIGVLFVRSAFAQKPPINFSDIASFGNWPDIGNVIISNNGAYIMFSIDQEPKGGRTMVIKTSNNKWERKYVNATSGNFTNDNKYATFTKSNGDAGVLNLSTNKEEAVPPYKASGEAIKNKTSVYFSNTKQNRLIVANSAQKDSLDEVQHYVFTPKKDGIIVTAKSGSENQQSLIWYDLNTKVKKKIWEGTAEQQFSFEHNPENNNYILLKLTEPLPKIDPALVDVDVWSYKDPSSPEPYRERKTTAESYYILDCNASPRLFKLTGPYERLLSVKGNFALVQQNIGSSPLEGSWNEKARSSFYLVSLIDGSKKLIAKQTEKGTMEAVLSPDGHFVVIADNGAMKFSSYNTATGILADLSKDIEISVRTIDVEYKYLGIYSTIWAPNNSIIVRDDYDLWKLDLTGQKAPLNITAGYGRLHQTTFYLTNIPAQFPHSRTELSNSSSGYILNAFNTNDKSWGFYSIPDLAGSTPRMLSMGPYYYGGEEPFIISAKKAGTYIVKRGTAKASPNLFVTQDFKKFSQISDIQPEMNYNWMSSELVKWKADNGRICDGILYKPEDFDSVKKYPVVVMIYNEFSSRLNQYVQPGGSQVDGLTNYLPVSWLISNGYLVFVPDIIHRKPGARLAESCDMLTSGVRNIARLPFVNSRKIGLQGASWGGEQVGYMVTHTNLFAAAFMGAGYSERISSSGYLDPLVQGNNLIGNKVHFGGLLTEVPNVYRDEAALFSANLLATPLLIKHNKNDAAVPFYQGFQFFRALRSLGKKVWMLQYEKGRHGVRLGKDNEDMCLRISQFFDHYLKDKPAPKWMTKGISPEQKQVDSGLELDTSGAIP